MDATVEENRRVNWGVIRVVVGASKIMGGVEEGGRCRETEGGGGGCRSTKRREQLEAVTIVAESERRRRSRKRRRGRWRGSM